MSSGQILIKLEFSRQIFEKYSNIKFHDNPSSGIGVVPHGRTDVTKLTVAFRNLRAYLIKRDDTLNSKLIHESH